MLLASIIKTLWSAARIVPVAFGGGRGLGSEGSFRSQGFGGTQIPESPDSLNKQSSRNQGPSP